MHIFRAWTKTSAKTQKDRNQIVGVALTKKLLIVSEMAKSDEVHKLKKVREKNDDNVQTPCSSLDHEQNTPTKFQNDRTKTVKSCAHKIPFSLRLRTDGQTHFNSLLRHKNNWWNLLIVKLFTKYSILKYQWLFTCLIRQIDTWCKLNALINSSHASDASW